jgi:hypothetical protein
MEPEVHHHIHKSPPPALYPGAGAPLHLLKINFNIILSARRCSKRSVSVGSPHLILLDLITSKTFGERYRARNSSLCCFSILLLLLFCEPQMSLLVPFSQTPSAYVFQCERPSFTPAYKKRQDCVTQPTDLLCNLCTIKPTMIINKFDTNN